MLWKRLIERMVRTDSLWRGLSDRMGWWVILPACTFLELVIVQTILVTIVRNCIIVESIDSELILIRDTWQACVYPSDSPRYLAWRNMFKTLLSLYICVIIFQCLSQLMSIILYCCGINCVLFCCTLFMLALLTNVVYFFIQGTILIQCEKRRTSSQLILQGVVSKNYRRHWGDGLMKIFSLISIPVCLLFYSLFKTCIFPSVMVIQLRSYLLD